MDLGHVNVRGQNVDLLHQGKERVDTTGIDSVSPCARD